MWESGELTTFASGVTLPNSLLEPGHTYRARVRMQDSTGRWSHWSAPVEFIASPGLSTPTLAIKELHYNPATNPGGYPPQELEFIELLNTGAATVNLSGVQLTTFASSPYVFAAGLSLAPGERIVVAKNPMAFQAVYGTGVNIAPHGYGSANLNNGGETISLATAGGAVLQSIPFDDEAGWPTSPDGGGRSLEIINPAGSASDPTNWRASAMVGGSPGWSGVGVTQGDYDRDGDVDGNDFVVWQRSLGSPSPALFGADGNGNMLVDAGDLGVWRDRFAPADEVAAAAMAVEPAPQEQSRANTAALRGIDDGRRTPRAVDAVFAAGNFAQLFSTTDQTDGPWWKRTWRARRGR